VETTGKSKQGMNFNDHLPKSRTCFHRIRKLLASIRAATARTPPESGSAVTDFAMINDLVAAIDSGNLAGSHLASLLRDTCTRPGQMRTSKNYSFNRVVDVINTEDARREMIRQGATVEGWRLDYWKIVASVATVIATSTEVSEAVGDWIIEFARRLFGPRYEPEKVFRQKKFSRL
jgi:hypothetical protein